MPRKNIIHLRSAIFSVVIVLPILIFWINHDEHPASANGQTVPILEITQEPYYIEVRVSPPTPRVGSLHVAIVLRTLEGREPVSHAAVTMTALGPAPEMLLAGPIEADTIPPTLHWYDFNIALPQAGDWAFTVDIVEEHQLTTINFPLSIMQVSVDWGVIVVFISAIPLLASVAWYVRTKLRNGEPMAIE
jgi:hypothetical protein